MKLKRRRKRIRRRTRRKESKTWRTGKKRRMRRV